MVNSKVLNSLYNPTGAERIGFIIGNKIVEVCNVSKTPEDSFVVSVEDIEAYSEKADATWHTHPSAGSNLSDEDYDLVTSWPDLKHYIIGQDGVSCYTYDEDKEAVIKLDV